MKSVSIGEMVRALHQLHQAGDLSEWESSFAMSVYGHSNKGADTSKLSDKQIEKVESIYQKHF